MTWLSLACLNLAWTMSQSGMDHVSIWHELDVIWHELDVIWHELGVIWPGLGVIWPGLGVI